MTDLVLRPALEADSPHIRELIHRVGINPLDLNWQRFLIAETAGGLFIGCGQLKPHCDGSLELASIAVEEAYRGRGTARALIDGLLEGSRRPLFLMCRPALGSFYEKFGFRLIAVREMTPYFRRMQRLTRLFALLARQSGPLIMRLD